MAKRQSFLFPIQTVYYRGNQIVKMTRSGSAFKAVPNCIRHMQINEYEATVAECFDLRDGVLHAVIRRSVEGNLHIIFKREVHEGV